MNIYVRIFYISFFNINILTTLTFAQTVVLSDPKDNSTGTGKVQSSSAFRSDVKVPLYSFELAVAGGGNSITNFSFTTSGTYESTDVTNFKLWWADRNSFGIAVEIGSTTTSLGPGTRSFTTFTARTLEQETVNNGRNYFWITMDVSASATCPGTNKTITVSGAAATDVSLGSAATKSGSSTAGNTITFNPKVSSSTYGTVNSGVAQTYTVTGTAGSTFAWTRAAVVGISNAADSGSGDITETLINTTNGAVAVTYTITPTHTTPSCTGTPFTYTVSVNPVNNATCSAVPVAPPAPLCGTLQNLRPHPTATVTKTNVSYGFCGTSFTSQNIDNGGTTTSPTYVLSGQTLTINGTLNSSGNIYVMPGATLNLSGNYDANNGNIYVYGTFNHTSVNSTLQSTATIYVAKTGVMNLGNTDFREGKIINEGIINATDIKMNINSTTRGILCLHNTGCFKTPSLSLLDNSNVITFAGAVGVFYYSGTTCPLASLNKPLTTSSDLRICAAVPTTGGTAGTTRSPCTKFSTAIVTYGCTPSLSDCPGAIALPITLAFFKPTLTNEGVIVKWGTNSQWDSDYFIIEKSKNGIDWEYVNTVPSENGKYRYKEFSVTDPNPYEGDSYYRLVEVDKNGNRTVYATDFIHNDKSFDGFSIYPNPSNGSFIVSISGDSPQYQMSVFDVLGNNLGVFTLLAGKNEISTAFASGIYLAKLKVGLDYYTQKIVVQ